MNIPPDKKTRLILIIVGTVAAMGLIWYVVIRNQQGVLRKKQAQIEESRSKLTNSKRLIERTDEIAGLLEMNRQKLQATENRMATGDKYSWVRKTVLDFQKGFNNVEITTFNPPQEGEMDLFPKYPYRAVSAFVTGTAYFHDFGRFLAKFENTFPHMRVQNLEVEPAGGGNGTADEERLAFKMEIVSLIKPN